MFVLVTGAAGGIGSRLAKRLWQKGHEVELVDDLSGGFRENLPVELIPRLICSDVSSPEWPNLLRSTKPPEVIVHLAGKSSLAECEQDPIGGYRANFLSTVSVAEYAKSVNAHLLFSSTSAVYEGVVRTPFTEQIEVSPKLTYPSSKHSAELYLHSMFEKTGFSSTILRLFNVFGESMNTIRVQPPFVNYLFRELAAGRVPTVYAPPHQGRDYVYIEDVLDLVELVIDRGRPAEPQTINVCSGKEITVSQIIAAVAEGAGMREFNYLQGDPEHFWSSFSSLSSSAFPLDANVVRNEVLKISLGDNTKARQELGWLPKTDVLEAIKNYSQELGRT